MFSKSARSLFTILALVIIAASLFACAAPAQPTAVPAAAQPTAAPAAAEPTAAPAATAGKIKVGLSFSDFATERWKNEQQLMEKLLTEKGYDVVWQEANHDVKLQNDQIDNMVTQGAKALIVIAEDGDAAATAVDKAAAAGVKVIAYDRLIKTPQHCGLHLLQQHRGRPPAGAGRPQGPRHRRRQVDQGQPRQSRHAGW